jgi:hypothetical protein
MEMSLLIRAITTPFEFHSMASEQWMPVLGLHVARVKRSEQAVADIGIEVVQGVIDVVVDRENAAGGHLLFESGLEGCGIFGEGSARIQPARSEAVVLDLLVSAPELIDRQVGVEIGQGRFHAAVAQQNARFLNGGVEHRGRLLGAVENGVPRREELAAVPNHIAVGECPLNRLGKRDVHDLIFARMANPPGRFGQCRPVVLLLADMGVVDLGGDAFVILEFRIAKVVQRFIVQDFCDRGGFLGDVSGDGGGGVRDKLGDGGGGVRDKLCGRERGAREDRTPAQTSQDQIRAHHGQRASHGARFS